MLKINNWSSHQSYKDRKPPWIRFHKSMLDDYEFHMMGVNARALLPMLWLLASEDDDPTSGLIKDSYKKIAFRLRCTEKEIVQAIKECAENGFLQVIEKQPCIEPVTKPYKDSTISVTPETETETETETEAYSKETEAEIKGQSRSDASPTPTPTPKDKNNIKKPPNVSEETWLAFNRLRQRKRAPISDLVLTRIKGQADIACISLEEALQECCERGWGSFKADWYNNSKGKQNDRGTNNTKPNAHDDFTAGIALALNELNQ